MPVGVDIRLKSMHISERDRRGIFLILSAIGIALTQGLMLGHWLVDDAGISIAYAHNLSHMGVLTAQIGAERVEGFSNPLWVFLLAGADRLGPPEPVVKILAGVLLSWCMLRFFFGLRKLGVHETVIFTTMLFLAFQPAVVIWVFSGLENSLYLAAGVELLVRICTAACGKATRRDNIIAGIAASALVLTRPDGIMYIPLYFLGSLVSGRRAHIFRETALSVLMPLICVCGYTIFRWQYFEALLPNAYLAKGGATLGRLLEVFMLRPHPISQLLSLSRTVFGEALQTWGLVFSVALLVTRLRRKPQSGVLVASALFAATATLTYLLLPGDWMPEARYATLLYPAYYLLMIYSISSIIPSRWIEVICVLLVISGVFSFIRVHQFSNNPPISIEEVQQRSDKFAQWGRAFGQSRCSILTADAGGFLLRNELDLIDLGMLCDRQIAEALGEGASNPDVKHFHDYIFNQRRPTFIATRAYHAWLADLESDSRFRRDYVPIREYPDIWVKQRYGERVIAGDFVRTDVVGIQYFALERVRSEASKLFYPFCVTTDYSRK